MAAATINSWDSDIFGAFLNASHLAAASSHAGSTTIAASDTLAVSIPMPLYGVIFSLTVVFGFCLNALLLAIEGKPVFNGLIAIAGCIASGGLLYLSTRIAVVALGRLNGSRLG